VTSSHIMVWEQRLMYRERCILAYEWIYCSSYWGGTLLGLSLAASNMTYLPLLFSVLDWRERCSTFQYVCPNDTRAATRSVGNEPNRFRVPQQRPKVSFNRQLLHNWLVPGKMQNDLWGTHGYGDAWCTFAANSSQSCIFTLLWGQRSWNPT